VASSNPWWLDIETASSWATSTTSGYAQLNIAAIQGFIAGLRDSGANGPIGIYSTCSQWNTIAGLNAQTTTAGLGLTTPPPDWWHLPPFIPVTNLLERSLGEVRRRTKVMGRFPGETSCLTLVWAVLELFFSHAGNGGTPTDVDRQHLDRLKYQQADPTTLDEEITAA
jgi:hypothetical protein